MSDVITRVIDDLLWVKLNRPACHHALTPQHSAQLHSIWVDYERDDSLRYAVITGSGEKAFSVGNDLRYQSADNDRSMMPQTGFAGMVNRAPDAKPILSLVSGYAYGGGFEAVLASRWALAVPHATFALTEAKWGTMPASGGCVRLPRQLPYKRAMAMLLCAQTLTAEQALEDGIIDRIVPVAEEDAMIATVRDFISSQ